MTRFVIFALLWPPAAFILGGFPHLSWSAIGFFFYVIGWAYACLIGPAVAFAALDLWLKRSRWGFLVLCAIGFLSVPLVFAHGSDANKFLPYALAGLVPTALCSVLARSFDRRKASEAVASGPVATEP